MNATSSAARATPEQIKKTRLPNGGGVVTEADLRDAQALQKALNMFNAGKKGHERLSDRELARYARDRGGSKHGHIWGKYRTGERRMPGRDKLILADRLAQSPGKVFPSFKKFPWKLLQSVLRRCSPSEQLLFSELLGLLATATSNERRKIMVQLKSL
jgi:hypothetical protein